MIVCAGENLIDMIEQHQSDPSAPNFDAIAGGSPYNCARALGRLGARVGYLTPISTDRMGDLLADALTQDDVVMLGGRSSRPTSLALVTVANGQPSYQFYREHAADRDFTLESLRTNLPDSTQALHLGSIALIEGHDAEALADLVKFASERGYFTSVDPNVRPILLNGDSPGYRARLERIFSMVNVIKISDEDLIWWDPGDTPEAAATALFESAQPELLVLTRGSRGMVVLHGNERWEVPAARVKNMADTVGAGDTLMAALLHGLADADALDRATLASIPGSALAAVMERAARAAAITCTRAGCNPPTRAELDGWTHNETGLNHIKSR